MSTCRFTPIAVTKRPMEGGDNSEGSNKIPTERLDCVLSSGFPPQCAASNLKPTYEGLRARETCEKECIAPYLTSKKGKEERTCSGKIFDQVAFDDDDQDENGNYTRRLSLALPNGEEMCTTVDSFLGWMDSQTKFVIWTKDKQTYNNWEEVKHDQGRGYAPHRPNIKLRMVAYSPRESHYQTVPEHFYFVLDKTGDAIIRYLRENTENSTIYLYMVRTRLPDIEDEDGQVGVYRYGNNLNRGFGEFGISGMHGQRPGTAVYLLRSTVPDHSTLTHEMALGTSTLAYEPLGETADEEENENTNEEPAQWFEWIDEEEDEERVALRTFSLKFFRAVYDGNVEEVQRILRVFDYFETDTFIFNHSREYAREINPTARHLAAWRGNVEVVKELCNFLGDQSRLELVNEANDSGETPLWIAAETGHAEVVQALIEAGADVNKATTNNKTPLWIAAETGHAEVVQALIEAEADVNKAHAYGTTPLFIAAQNGHVEVVQALIEAEADVNKAETDGTTPLLIASQNGHAEVVVSRMYMADPDVDKANVHGMTPLLFAAKNGHADVVQALIEADADVNKANRNGFTPLFMATQNRHAEIVQALIEAGASSMT